MKGSPPDPVDKWFMLMAIRIVTGRGPMPVLKPSPDRTTEETGT